MRSEFEKLPEIRERLELSKTFGSLVFDGVLNMYLSGSICHILIEQVNFVNGAWYVYQEQQKKLDHVCDESKTLIAHIKFLYEQMDINSDD